MSKHVIEEAIKKYDDVKMNAENEIARIKEQLLAAGVPGETIVKLKPRWQPDVSYLLNQHLKN